MVDPEPFLVEPVCVLVPEALFEPDPVPVPELMDVPAPPEPMLPDPEAAPV